MLALVPFLTSSAVRALSRPLPPLRAPSPNGEGKRNLDLGRRKKEFNFLEKEIGICILGEGKRNLYFWRRNKEFNFLEKEKGKMVFERGNGFVRLRETFPVSTMKG